MARGQSQHWVECLPLVLLGIHSTIKEDLRCCPAKLVFGTMLRLPGELVASTSPDTTEDAANFVHHLKISCEQSPRSLPNCNRGKNSSTSNSRTSPTFLCTATTSASHWNHLMRVRSRWSHVAKSISPFNTAGRMTSSASTA